MAKAPFSGSSEFKLTIRAFDEQVIRKAQVTYTYTPTWPYYDARSRKELDGDPRLEFGLVVTGRTPLGQEPVNFAAFQRAILGSGQPAPDYRHFEPASSRPTPLPRGRRSA
jgi:hypothetical protein